MATDCEQSGQRPVKIVLVGTHPSQYTGYSLVVHELSAHMADAGAEVHVFGFQRSQLPSLQRAPHSGVRVFDAAAAEASGALERSAHQQVSAPGFGLDHLPAFVRETQPDAVVVYNDMVVISACLERLASMPERRSFRVLAYVDQVYANQRPAFVYALNTRADEVIAFDGRWADCLRSQGVHLPVHALPHGVNTLSFYPVPRHLARAMFGLPRDAFVVLNMNRNQPRKRWDTCLSAWAEFVSRHPGEPVTLVCATHGTGAWPLLEVFHRELRKRGVDPGAAAGHITLLDTPHALTELEVNALYNAADVGINTADGEGFGLCQIQQAAVGVPQVVSQVGGLKHMFDASMAMLCPPVATYYSDSSRDSVGGEAELCDPMDFVLGLEAYYSDPELRRRHGAAARARFTGPDYRWDGIARRLIDLCRPDPGACVAAPPPTPEGSTAGASNHPGEQAPPEGEGGGPAEAEQEAPGPVAGDEGTAPPPPAPPSAEQELIDLRRQVAAMMETLSRLGAPPPAAT